MRRPFAFLALALLFAACAKEEPKKEEKPASSDDDDDGKKKDKKAKKEKKGDDEEKRDEEDTGTPDDGVEDVKKDDGPPPPALCAPANDSPLGAKPKLLSSAGQPNASVAVWAMAGAPVVGTIAVTLSADKKCYVEYVSAPEFAIKDGVGISKVYVSAANGKGEKTGATVAFRVAYSVGYRTPAGDVGYWNDEARFYGYAPANGIPYSCKPLDGEKNDRCAMYHKPLTTTVKVACKKVDAKTGKFGVESPLGAPSIVIKTPTIASVIKPIIGGAPLDGGIAIPLVTDAGADTGSACPDPQCITTAWLQKENDRVYVRAAAGKPIACGGPGNLHAGETWYFDETHWKKR